MKLFTLLLENNADLYSTNNQGYNVIMSVILYNRIDMLKYIISKKSNSGHPSTIFKASIEREICKVVYVEKR